MEEQKFAVVYLDSADLAGDSRFGVKMPLLAYLATQLHNSFSLAQKGAFVLLSIKFAIPLTGLQP